MTSDNPHKAPEDVLVDDAIPVATHPFDVVRPLTRRERRIERMRVQRQPSASRVRYDVSGTPRMARQAPYREVIR